ncbi:MAG: hypothetical protein MUE49_13175 [Rhodospirillales bacterium]|jgi:prophage tail gpP-like protein|nr:hypothetical protein [Rhodospirillales bacterium]
MIASDVTLTVDGAVFGGWTDVAAERSIEAVAGGFSLGMTERWPGQAAPRPVPPGSRCTLSWAGQAVITGWVRAVEISETAHDVSMRVTGQDAAADLVDCAAAVGAGEWHGLRLDEIVQEIARPFGIDVAVETDVGAPFPVWRVREGERAWEAIERAARQRAVLVISDGDGGIVITRAGAAAGTPPSLADGEGGVILTQSQTTDTADRYSLYIAKGQRRGTDDEPPEMAAHAKAQISDPAVRRYRPMVLLAEDMADGISLQQRVAWEARIAAARSRRFHVSVQGWTDERGRLWQPNRRVHVRMLSRFRAVNEVLLIVRVRWRLDDGGAVSDIEMAMPEAYDVAGAMPSSEPGW